MKKHTYIKIFSLVLIFCFAFEEMARGYGQIHEVKPFIESGQRQIFIPEKSGKIISHFKKRGEDEFLYILEDAHVNYGAQQSLAEILESLFSQADIKTVFLEAGTGDDSLSSLRSLAAKEDRQKIGKTYLRRGLIQGADYFDLISDKPVQLWGVEDKTLYYQSLALYREISARKDFATAYLDRFDKNVRNIREKILSPGLYRLNKKTTDYEEGRMPVGEFAEFILSEIDHSGLPRSLFKSLERVKDLFDQEKIIDFKKAQEQFEHWASLNKVNFPKNLSIGPDGHEKRFDFFNYYHDAIQKDAQIFRDLAAYAKYSRLASAMPWQALLDEMELAQETLFLKLASSPSEIRFLNLKKDIRALKNLALLRAMPEEVSRAKTILRGKGFREMQGFLNEALMDYQISPEYAVIWHPRMLKIFDQALEFYALAERRDEAFLKNILEKMSETGEKESAFVVGGYHSKNLQQKLRSLGIAYMVIRPVFFQETSNEKYEERLFSAKPLTPAISGKASLVPIAGMLGPLPGREAFGSPRGEVRVMGMLDAQLAEAGARMAGECRECSHDHSRTEPNNKLRKAQWIALFVNAAVAVPLFWIGYKASLGSVETDAGHGFVDSFSIATALLGNWLRFNKKLTDATSYAGVINALLLVGVISFAMLGALMRVSSPPAAQVTLTSLGVVAFAVAANLIVYRLLHLGNGHSQGGHGHQHRENHDLGSQSAVSHARVDVGISVGALFSSLLIYSHSSLWPADPIVAFAMGAGLLFVEWGFLKQAYFKAKNIFRSGSSPNEAGSRLAGANSSESGVRSSGARTQTVLGHFKSLAWTAALVFILALSATSAVKAQTPQSLGAVTNPSPVVLIENNLRGAEALNSQAPKSVSPVRKLTKHEMNAIEALFGAHQLIDKVARPSFSYVRGDGKIVMNPTTFRRKRVPSAQTGRYDLSREALYAAGKTVLQEQGILSDHGINREKLASFLNPLINYGEKTGADYLNSFYIDYTIRQLSQVYMGQMHDGALAIKTGEIASSVTDPTPSNPSIQPVKLPKVEQRLFSFLRVQPASVPRAPVVAVSENFSSPSVAGGGGPPPPPKESQRESNKTDLFNLRNWVAYASPYTDFYFTGPNSMRASGELLIRVKPPLISLGESIKMGPYVGVDLNLRFLKENGIPQTEKTANAIIGANFSGFRNPLLDSMQVSFASLGKQVGFDLMSKAFSKSGNSWAFSAIPQNSLYLVTDPKGRRGPVWVSKVATHWVLGKKTFEVTPGFVRLPNGKMLFGGSIVVPMRGFDLYGAANINLPHDLQDVMPGAHAKPGVFEWGLRKGSVKFGVGKKPSSNLFYAAFTWSPGSLRIGNKQIPVSHDGHLMISPAAEIGHVHTHDHEPSTNVEVTSEEFTVIPPSFENLLKDPFLRGKQPILRYDRDRHIWRLRLMLPHEGHFDEHNLDLPVRPGALGDPAAEERFKGYYDDRKSEIDALLPVVNEETRARLRAEVEKFVSSGHKINEEPRKEHHPDSHGHSQKKSKNSTVIPPSLKRLLDDPFLKGMKPTLSYDLGVWTLTYMKPHDDHSHEEALRLPVPLNEFKDSAVRERFNGYYVARVEEILDQIRMGVDPQTQQLLLKEARGFGVLPDMIEAVESKIQAQLPVVQLSTRGLPPPADVEKFNVPVAGNFDQGGGDWGSDDLSGAVQEATKDSTKIPPSFEKLLNDPIFIEGTNPALSFDGGIWTLKYRHGNHDHIHELPVPRGGIEDRGAEERFKGYYIDRVKNEILPDIRKILAVLPNVADREAQQQRLLQLLDEARRLRVLKEDVDKAERDIKAAQAAFKKEGYSPNGSRLAELRQSDLNDVLIERQFGSRRKQILISAVLAYFAALRLSGVVFVGGKAFLLNRDASAKPIHNLSNEQADNNLSQVIQDIKINRARLERLADMMGSKKPAIVKLRLSDFVGRESSDEQKRFLLQAMRLAHQKYKLIFVLDDEFEARKWRENTHKQFPSLNFIFLNGEEFPEPYKNSSDLRLGLSDESVAPLYDFSKRNFYVASAGQARMGVDYTAVFLKAVLILNVLDENWKLSDPLFSQMIEAVYLEAGNISFEAKIAKGVLEGIIKEPGIVWSYSYKPKPIQWEVWRFYSTLAKIAEQSA